MKPGDRVKVYVPQAGLIPQQKTILAKMIKSGGDGMVLIKSIDGDYANVAGWEGDALLGTLRVPVKALRENGSTVTSKFLKMIESHLIKENSDYSFMSDEDIKKLNHEDAKKEMSRIESLIHKLRSKIFDVSDDEADRMGNEIDKLKAYMFKVQNKKKGFEPDKFKHWMYAAEESLSSKFIKMAEEDTSSYYVVADPKEADKIKKSGKDDKAVFKGTAADAAKFAKDKMKGKDAVLLKRDDKGKYEYAVGESKEEPKAQSILNVFEGIIEKDRDFLGEYDWPEEEALMAADDINDMIDSGEYTKEEIKQKVDKDFKHWLKVFGDDEQGKRDMKRFKEVLMDKLSHKIDFNK